MLTQRDFEKKIYQIDGKSYKAYKYMAGVYQFGLFKVYCDYIQGDPFASPSRIRVRLPQQIAKFPSVLFEHKIGKIAIEDFLTRRFTQCIRQFVKGKRGTGKSGMIAIDKYGQEILERSSVLINKEFVEARFVMGLPAQGRRVLGKQAVEMFCNELPHIINQTLFYEQINQEALQQHVSLAEDQHYIRCYLRENNLVAFVANGSILPRQSGVSDRPLEYNKTIPFQSPPDMEIEIILPHYGVIKGMAIKEGVTLIVGGGYHGKSTVLKALERGVYDHIKGDGREYVITVNDAVKIRAEDGRRIEKVDISPFINNLPYGRDTSRFSTDDASGSTSQATNIMEAIEVGTHLLLLDEDTSATNFMIRDARMQRLVAKDKEPITPFIDRVKQLYTHMGISTVLVVGGSGDYFDVADSVVMLDEYRLYEVGEQANKIASQFTSLRHPEGGQPIAAVKERVLLPQGFDPQKGRKIKIDAKGLYHIQFGNESIDLQSVEQMIDISQTRAIGAFIYYCLRHSIDGKKSLQEIIDTGIKKIEENGLDILSPFANQPYGDFAKPRKYEIAAAINRLRTLKVK